MKTRNLTLEQIFALEKELSKDLDVSLKARDMGIYKQLFLTEYKNGNSEILFRSKIYKQKYFDKRIIKLIKERNNNKELPH